MASTVRHTVKARGKQREKRFPLNTSPQKIADWKARERKRLEAERPRPSRGTLAQDIERYLATLIDRRALLKERTYQLDWWEHRFGKLRRSDITAPMIRAALAELRTTKAASTCNHYRIALSHLWTTLDGKNAANPCRDVPMFEEPEAEPRNLPPALVTAILDAFPSMGRAVKNQKRSAVSLGALRLRVMATTGLSPAEIMRIRPGDVQLADRAVYVRRRQKGKGADGMMYPLLQPGVDALAAFADAHAFGSFSTHALYQSWVRACKRLLKGELDAASRRLLTTARPYDLRHTFGTFLLQHTQNLATTKELMRHRSSKTTKRYVRAAVAPHLRAALDRQPVSL